METGRKRTCVVLFADISGSTKLYETLGDSAAKRLITGIQAIFTELVKAENGDVHEIIGDEVMACFADAESAAKCSFKMQQAIAEYPTDSGEMMALRIGMHGGPVLVDGARIFGDTINLAARMAEIAQGGQIVTTAYVANRLPESMRDVVRKFDFVSLKGKREPVEVYDLLWRPQDLTIIHTVTPGEAASCSLTLGYRQQHYRLAPDYGQFVIGRSASSDLVVTWKSVSRNHAVIAFNRGRFVLSDSSTNGTHVQTANGESLYLRRESMPMWGMGQIALGAPFNNDGEHILNYKCE